MVIDKEKAERKAGLNQFYQGKAERYKTEMTEEQIQECNITLRKVIVGLGYEI
jgi:hypothetical protein